MSLSCSFANDNGLFPEFKKYNEAVAIAKLSVTLQLFALFFSIYLSTGSPKHKFGKILVGEVMGCSMDVTDNTVTFFRNGNTVCGHYAYIMHPYSVCSLYTLYL